MQGPLAHLSSHTELHKIMQGALRGFHPELYKLFPQGHAQDYARTSDAISLGSPQDPLSRTCTRARKGL